MPRLLVEDAAGIKSVFELDSNGVVIGRSSEAGLVVRDGRASRRHAEIGKRSGSFVIQDLNSGNGLYVNGRRVTEAALATGDVIRIGHSTLVFDDSGGSRDLQFSDEDGGYGDVVVRRIEDAASPAGVSPAESSSASALEKELYVLRRKEKILTLMYELGRALQGLSSAAEVYNQVTALLLEICGADRVLILEIDSNGGLRFAHQAAAAGRAAGRTVSRTVTQKVTAERVTLLSTNAAADPALAQGQSIVLQQIRSVICAPLLVRDQVQALIYLDQERVAAFAVEDLDVVNGVAAQAAIALENVHALQRQAHEAEVRQAYSRFLPQHVVEDLLKSPGKLKLGGTNQIATVLFADIRGFTRMSARMEPEEVVNILNEYFGEMTEIIFRHGGTLDKFIGDGLMALFGAPYAGPEDAANAVRTAIDMQRQIQTQNGLGIGIGINTGLVTAGYVGSARRFDYTAIGDTVNMASRLESNAPAGEIYLAQSTYAELQGLFPCAPLEIKVKGKDEPLHCHRLLWTAMPY